MSSEPMLRTCTRAGEWSESLPELLGRQRGLIRRHQALALGISSRAIHWRITHGRWRRVLSGLYATFTEDLTDEHRLIAAALYGGDGAQITGAAALRWHNVRYAPRGDHIDVLIPATVKRSSQDFVRIIRTTRLDPHSRLRPALEVCAIARAAADAARASRRLREVRAFVGEVVQRRLTTLPELVDELRDGPAAGSAVLRRVLDDLAAGVRSAPEAEFRDLIQRSKVLPPVLWNAPLVSAAGLRLPTPDGWIQDVGIALEVDSREHHSSQDGWSRTLDRHNQLAAVGVLTLHFTPRQIRETPERVLQMVEAAYLQRLVTHCDFATARFVDGP
jgi:hypothetical protein